MQASIVSSMKIAAVFAGVMAVSACGSSGMVYDGSKIEVRARQTQLETDVSLVSNEYRDLRDRFDVLERLYVDLARNVGTQNQSVQELSTQFSQVSADPRVQNELTEARTQIAVLKNELTALRDRLVSVERTSNAGPFETIQNISNDQGAANAAPETAPATSPVEAPSIQPTASDAAPAAGPQYGLHLASLRQASQASSSLMNLKRSYPAVIDPLEARLYRQTQGGLAIFRLLLGPFNQEAAAEQACATLRSVQTDQYCRVTVFEGDPIPGAQ